MTLLSLDVLYVIAGLMLTFVAARSARNFTHRHCIGTTSFWGALAVIFIFGNLLPAVVVGAILVWLAVLAAAKQVDAPSEPPVSAEKRSAAADRLGNRIFIPALAIPATAVLSTLIVTWIPLGKVQLFDPKNPTLAALGFGAIVALVLGLCITRSRPVIALNEGSRLIHTIGWALLLPQLLAALGGIFAKAGLGKVIADVVETAFPTQYPFVAVAVYCLGMALFTICLGNAFAAFPVITLGIGLPIVVHRHGGNPAIMAALGMLSGYCGTLLTPMAANFNLVPAILLELRDQNAVIKAQAPIAVVLLLANILILYLCVFRF